MLTVYCIIVFKWGPRYKSPISHPGANVSDTAGCSKLPAEDQDYINLDLRRHERNEPSRFPWGSIPLMAKLPSMVSLYATGPGPPMSD